ncbi:transposase [Caerostris darwini]|uniref:Transposase n=1 Tax=Caerostris darwini TaxID=1538125 RepID=A0AAV4SYV7_9ARAC|nr:transposase [Caerostris darwini]
MYVICPIKKKLKRLGYVKKLDLWRPHQLKEIHLTQRISICDSLLKRHEIDPFLKQPKKIMLPVWRDYKGILYYDLLSRNQTINSNMYVQQLAKPSHEVQEKRSESTNRNDIVFQQDNAKLHRSLLLAKHYWN